MKESTERALDAIGETAAEWVLAMQDAAASENQKAAFTQWLRQSPVHVREYLHAEAAWLALDTAARASRADIRQLLEQVAPNVVSLNTRQRKIPFDAIAWQRRAKALGTPIKVWTSAAVILLTLGFAFLGSAALDWLKTDTYRTDIGEQRRIVLGDGTEIDLNTRTTVRAKFDTHTRNIRLLAGEAIFNVAKDPARPFSVLAGRQHITALGTSFAVRQEPGKTTITLIEGKIAVARTHTPDDSEKTSIIDNTALAAVVLRPGQRARFSSRNETPQIDTPMLEKVTASRQHRLIFENQTVAEVVAEFNRYNRRQILVEDAALASERIDGVFDADKPQNLLDFLVRNTGARIKENFDVVRVVK